ncbi:hypothetical protein C6P61_07165 [Malikia spinosa]|uniref:Uncharacterized protein n=1 Tax=Malikia spinosa TaxID=86180 RepID=A0A2S9KFI1_9BURK|nr:hypothetical protein [Malikia spinosa]PRD69201.1 hypothetical protein C6P61_07165 [Malikia spinosa]
MKQPLSKLVRVPMREAWKHEANDFTPWLAEEDNGGFCYDPEARVSAKDCVMKMTGNRAKELENLTQ